jgi:hypothetical protein
MALQPGGTPMVESMQFGRRMSDADSLMWHAEKDPLLRSTITVVWHLDRPPDAPVWTTRSSVPRG